MQTCKKVLHEHVPSFLHILWECLLSSIAGFLLNTLAPNTNYGGIFILQRTILLCDLSYSYINKLRDKSEITNWKSISLSHQTCLKLCYKNILAIKIHRPAFPNLGPFWYDWTSVPIILSQQRLVMMVGDVGNWNAIVLKSNLMGKTVIYYM